MSTETGNLQITNCGKKIILMTRSGISHSRIVIGIYGQSYKQCKNDILDLLPSPVISVLKPEKRQLDALKPRKLQAFPFHTLKVNQSHTVKQTSASQLTLPSSLWNSELDFDPGQGGSDIRLGGDAYPKLLT